MRRGFLPGGWAEDPERSETEGERSLVESVRFGDDRRPGRRALAIAAVAAIGQEPPVLRLGRNTWSEEPQAVSGSVYPEPHRGTANRPVSQAVERQPESSLDMRAGWGCGSDTGHFRGGQPAARPALMSSNEGCTNG
jgi:hypothetical protein